jgi:hypothetical protein
MGKKEGSPGGWRPLPDRNRRGAEPACCLPLW